jgi:hypothetical protein
MGPQTKEVGQGFPGILLSSQDVLGTEVDDAQEGSWGRCFVVLALLCC